MDQNYFMMLPNLEPDELMFLQNITNELSDDQKKQFVMVYHGKRKDSQSVLLVTLAGFIGVAGIQRFLTGDIGLGILYLLTLGLCGIGTIIDLVNYKSLTKTFNQKQAYDAMTMVRMMSNK